MFRTLQLLDGQHFFCCWIQTTRIIIKQMDSWKELIYWNFTGHNPGLWYFPDIRPWKCSGHYKVWDGQFHWPLWNFATSYWPCSKKIFFEEMYLGGASDIYCMQNENSLLLWQRKIGSKLGLVWDGQIWQRQKILTAARQPKI